MFTISAVIITKNEEEKIKDCLESVKWCDELVLVDNYSDDKTVDIAKKYGAKIIQTKDSSFDNLRNLGTRKSRSDWILHIDADERATNELKSEILSLINDKNKEFTSYAVPRKNYVFGKQMKYCGLWPDYVQHLIKKDCFIAWKNKLHETPEMKGEVGKLKSPLIHHKHKDISSMVDKTNKWSEIEAKMMYDANHPKMIFPRFFSAMCREFWLRMIKQKAFLDGSEGIIYAIYQVWSRYLSYAKLWEMQISKNK